MSSRAERIEVRRAEMDPSQFYIVKVAGNGEPVWSSELYRRRESAVEAAKREGPGLELVDRSDETR